MATHKNSVTSIVRVLACWVGFCLTLALGYVGVCTLKPKQPGVIMQVHVKSNITCKRKIRSRRQGPIAIATSTRHQKPTADNDQHNHARVATCISYRSKTAVSSSTIFHCFVCVFGFGTGDSPAAPAAARTFGAPVAS